MHVVVLGDSVGAGCWDREGGWVDRVRSELYGRVVDDDAPSYESDAYAEVYNLSVSGETAVGTVDRFDEVGPRLSDWDTNVVVLAVGANDAYRLDGDLNTDPGRFKEVYGRLLEEARAEADHVICVGLPPVDEGRVDPVPWRTEISYLEADRDRYADMIAEVAGEYGVPVVAPFDDVQESEKDDLLDDGIHLSTEGHRRLAAAVLDVLEAISEG
jgi:lysophospholipase L1-like esterase